MPLHRRLPKRGFTNIFKKEWAEVNVADLARFEAEITPEALVAAGLVRKSKQGAIAILGQGDVTKALTVRAHRFTSPCDESIAFVTGGGRRARS